MKKIGQWFLLLLTIIISEDSIAGRIIQKTDTLPRKMADLSIRFQHLEPYLPDPQLVASWAMDEGSGYQFVDASGNEHTAYITGYNWNTTNSGLTASFRKMGKRAGCVFLDGTQWLQVKDTADLNRTTFMTLSLWLKPVSKGNSVLISRQNGDGGYSLLLGNRDNIILKWIDKDGNSQSCKTAPLSIDIKDWNHVSVTVDQEKEEIGIYLNGELTATQTEASFSDKSLHEDLFIGSRKDDPSSCYTGYLDEISIYKKALSPQELTAQYITGLPKVYTQCRATINPGKTHWTAFRGNEFVPHPHKKDTKLLLHFNGSLTSESGIAPINAKTNKAAFIPGVFGGALAPQSSQSLVYPLGLTSGEGTFEAWLINGKNDPIVKDRQVVFKINGDNDSYLTVYKKGNKWVASLYNRGNNTQIETKELASAEGALTHLAITWQAENITLWINGVLQKTLNVKMPVLNGNIEIRNGDHAFTGYIDDIRVSGKAKSWNSICPTGYIASESAALDLMDSFNKNNAGLFQWTPLSPEGSWHHVQDFKKVKNPNDGFLQQTNPKHLHPITHPDAFGFSSSFQSSILFDQIQDGWAGVFTNAEKDTLFSGISFSMNSKKNLLRLAIYKSGEIVSEKVTAYDFPIKINQRYTLTLSVYPDVIRGFVDGHNLIAINREGNLEKGYAGMLTINSIASFDDVHFTALTPSVKNSRLLQTRIFTDAPANDLQPSFKNYTYNAFRWKKRYGVLPWQRTGKNPEPPGNIFGPEQDVARPNPIQSWRSEDSANSDIMMVDGKMYYSMRGNPDVGGPHGPAALGMLMTTQSQFDGIHFNDLNADALKADKIGLLQGHAIKDSECNAPPPRDKRFQLNDQGMVYLDGKILIVLRESRNRIEDYPRFRRLVYGLFDIKTKQWLSHEPFIVSWSTMDPDNCYAKLKGINGTPEIFNLKDPLTDKDIILLFYAKRGNSMVAALQFDGKNLELHPDLPQKLSFIKADGDITYGQRIFFDNGIYYMNVNAGSNKEKLKKDWPDRFQLLTTLDPYNGPWIESSENTNTERPYFTRGDWNDPDNAAIWQGTIFKYRNHYYLYYENYHSISDINRPYHKYDAVHSGSRVGFATGN